MKPKPKGGEDGFTLIEIIIVVAIIGMLAAIAVPNYMEARLRCQMRACICNLRLIDGVVAEWAAEARKQSGESVSYDDIRRYMNHEVTCPAGGKTFADSYTISSVDSPAACLRVATGPYSHKLD